MFFYLSHDSVEYNHTDKYKFHINFFLLIYCHRLEVLCKHEYSSGDRKYLIGMVSCHHIVLLLFLLHVIISNVSIQSYCFTEFSFTLYGSLYYFVILLSVIRLVLGANW